MRESDNEAFDPQQQDSRKRQAASLYRPLLASLMGGCPVVSVPD